MRKADMKCREAKCISPTPADASNTYPITSHLSTLLKTSSPSPTLSPSSQVASGNWQVLPSPSTPSMVGHSSILVAVLPCSVRSGEQKKKKKLQRNRGEGRKKKRTDSYMGDALFGAGQEASTPAFFFSLTETGLGFNNLGILLLFFGFVFLRCFLLCGGPICIEKILDLQRSSELHQRSFFILNLEVILGFL